MCGRISRKTPRHLVAEFLSIADEGPDFPPRYNIPPGAPILALRMTKAGSRELCFLHWGLIPSWAKDKQIGWRTINARAETLHEKPAFSTPLRTSRCLIPADGFYEWQAEGKKKQPYYFRRPGGELVYLAGLWTRWSSPAGEQIESCSIITTEANALVHPVHHRMPVVIAENEIDHWLDPAVQDLEQIKKLLVPCPPDYLLTFPVSARVNDPRNDEPLCLEQLAVA